MMMVKSDLQGRVLTAFVISSKGVVLSSNIQASTTNDSELDACIAQAVKRWEFPKPEDNSMTMTPCSRNIAARDLRGRPPRPDP